MSHVCVQRLPAGDDQKHGAQDRESDDAVVLEEGKCMRGSNAPRTAGKPRRPDNADTASVTNQITMDRTEQPSQPVGRIADQEERRVSRP